MNGSEIRELSDEALVHRELALERELVSAKFRLSMQQLEDTSVIKRLRRDIARLQTEARQREVAQGINKNGLKAMHASSYSADTQDSADQNEESGGFLQGIVDKLSSND